jgi:uncharacterized protein with GYD domain
LTPAGFRRTLTGSLVDAERIRPALRGRRRRANYPMAPHSEWRAIMAKYIALASFTDQGIRNVKGTLERADAVKEAAGRYGCQLSQIYWTLGSYDVVTVIDAPDDASATAFSLAIGSAGNVRTQTLRAFSRDEMSAILGKLG